MHDLIGLRWKVWMKTGMFMQALCEVAVSVLPEHIIGMDIGSD